MKLFNRFSTRSRIIAGAVVLALAAVMAVAVPASTHALLGGDRETKAYEQGMSGFDHVQFNSFTGVPDIGDERNFLTGMLDDGSSTNFYDPINDVRSGDTLLLRVYIHNNADTSLNADGTGIAKNTKVRISLPSGMATDLPASAFISADNARPQVIEDTLDMRATTPVALQFVPGSASIESHTGTFKAALSDDIVTNGVTVGSDALDGNYKGCFDYVASVTFKVKVISPNYQLTKTVRKNGTTTFGPSVTVNSGDKVDFSLNFKNTGTTNLDNVVLADRLPVGLTYVPNTTTWDSAYTNNQWQPVTNDGWMKGGLNVGGYGPGGTVFVRFTAVVDDPSKLQCGLNQLVNFGFAQPQNQGTIQASAEVDVTKDCATATPTPTPTQTPTPAPTPTTTPTPAPSQPSTPVCGVLDVSIDNASRTVKVTTFTAGGGTFKTVDLDWGENGVVPLSTNTPVGQTHQYGVDSGDSFTIRATAHFSTNGSNDVTATSEGCTKQVSFTAPAATSTSTPAPTQLVNTGAGDVISIFAVATVIGAFLHRLFLSRLARR